MLKDAVNNLDPNLSDSDSHTFNYYAIEQKIFLFPRKLLKMYSHNCLNYLLHYFYIQRMLMTLAKKSIELYTVIYSNI